jgi:NTE family protein
LNFVLRACYFDVVFKAKAQRSKDAGTSDQRPKAKGPRPKTNPQTMERPKIGLALSGGAARGIAHVGVLRALTEAGIPIDYVAGTSAGSIVGGAFAAGMTIDQIEDLSVRLRWRHVGRLTLSRFGFQSNQRLEDYLRARLPVTSFDRLRIPFAAIATDLRSGEPVVMRDTGDVPFAIRASCTIPGWYVPVNDKEGRQLVDGGLVAVIPASFVRSMGADFVISVDVNADGARFFGSRNSPIAVMLQAALVAMKTSSKQQVSLSDLVITPRIGHIRWDQLRRARELMDAGYEAGKHSVPEIQKLLETAAKPLPISPAWQT